MNIPKLSLHPSFHIAKVRPILENDEIIGCGSTGELRQLYLGEPIGIAGIYNKAECCGSLYTKDLTILCDLCGAYKDVLLLEISKYKNTTVDTVSLSAFSNVLDMENSDDDSSDELESSSIALLEKRAVHIKNVEILDTSKGSDLALSSINAESVQLVNRDFVVNTEEETQQDDIEQQTQMSFYRSVLNFAQENKKTLICLGGLTLLNTGILACRHFSEMAGK